MKKRIVSVFLAAFIILGAIPAAASGGLSNFKKVNTYTDKTFYDVKPGNWFAENVKQSYELGLFLGIGDGRFVPRGDISVIQTITVACRIHKIYNEGNADFEKTSPWHTAYMDYAVKNGIVKRGEFTNLEKSATRAQFAYILANALPSREYGKINSVNKGEIPDVMGNEYFADAVYTLYNAGIIIGSDDYGTFAPNTPIERSGVAAIATRMADTSLRLKKALKPAYKEYSTKDFSIKVPVSIEEISYVDSHYYENVYDPYDGHPYASHFEIKFNEKLSFDNPNCDDGWVFTIRIREDDTIDGTGVDVPDDYTLDYNGYIKTSDGRKLHVLCDKPDGVNYDGNNYKSEANYYTIRYLEASILSSITPKNGTFVPKFMSLSSDSFIFENFDNWRAAYQNAIENAIDCLPWAGEYVVYDIEKDGIPELFTHDCDASSLDDDWHIWKYYPTLKRVSYIGSLYAHMGGYIYGVDGENAFYLMFTVSGVDIIEKYTMQNGTLVGTYLFDCNLMGDHDEISDLKECEAYSIYDNSGLNWTKNDDAGNRHIVDNLHAPLSNSFN